MGEEEDYGTLIYRDMVVNEEGRCGGRGYQKLLAVAAGVKRKGCCHRQRERQTRQFVEEVIFIFSVGSLSGQKWNGY